MPLEEGGLLDPLEAAYRLGITAELLFKYTTRTFARSSGLRSLATVERSGSTWFRTAELDAFDALLAGPWVEDGLDRPGIPAGILDHLHAESMNQCSRCGSGVGVQTAHIVRWADSRSHHHGNLIRICSACHDEHDIHNSLPTETLLAIKAALVETTRDNLRRRMSNVKVPSGAPRPTARFEGRRQELPDLVQALRSVRSIAVTGVGGIGKTELLSKALADAGTGRPVIWLDIGQYSNWIDVLSALRLGLGNDGLPCAEAAIADRMDAIQACIVLDGIEASALADLDALDDAVAAMLSATALAQFVTTSQVKLHVSRPEFRLELGRLADDAGRALLRNSDRSSGADRRSDDGPLLEFCEGHALSLRLASALIEHYDGADAAMRAIAANGVGTFRIPGRGRHDRTTSLELCLLTAYDAISLAARRLLWALSNAPAGLPRQHLEGDWLGLGDPLERLAELRHWHLIDLVVDEGGAGRIRVLAPIRAYAIERARHDAPLDYETVSVALAHALMLMVAYFERDRDASDDTPRVLRRYGDELPNLLRLLELAGELPSHGPVASAAMAIARALMRYFFVVGPSEQGARVMMAAAELAIASAAPDRSSGLIVQAIALAHRANASDLVATAMSLADRLEAVTKDEEALADLLQSRGMAAFDAGDHARAERYALSACQGYRRRLRQRIANRIGGGAGVDPAELDELHNDLSGALGLLGFCRLSLGKHGRALKAYRHSLRHQRGNYIAVNRGQTLHQIGNCESHLGAHSSAIDHYLEAARIFLYVGMAEYLSNALAELGYSLLDVDPVLTRSLDVELVRAGLSDLFDDAVQAFDEHRAIDVDRRLGVARKVGGMLMLACRAGVGAELQDWCARLAEAIDPQGKAMDGPSGAVLPMLGLVLGMGTWSGYGEHAMRSPDGVPQGVVDELLILVCNAAPSTRARLRLVDWLALLLDRWGFDGGGRQRLAEFMTAFDDDEIDYLDLARRA